MPGTVIPKRHTLNPARIVALTDCGDTPANGDLTRGFPCAGRPDPGLPFCPGPHCEPSYRTKGSRDAPSPGIPEPRHRSGAYIQKSPRIRGFASDAPIADHDPRRCVNQHYPLATRQHQDFTTLCRDNQLPNSLNDSKNCQNIDLALRKQS